MSIIDNKTYTLLADKRRKKISIIRVGLTLQDCKITSLLNTGFRRQNLAKRKLMIFGLLPEIYGSRNTIRFYLKKEKLRLFFREEGN